MSLEQFFIPMSTMFVDDIRAACNHALYSVVMTSYSWLISISKEGGRRSYSDQELDTVMLCYCQRLVPNNFDAYVIKRETVDELISLDKFPHIPRDATDRLKQIVSVIKETYDKLPPDHSIIYLRNP